MKMSVKPVLVKTGLDLYGIEDTDATQLQRWHNTAVIVAGALDSIMGRGIRDEVVVAIMEIHDERF